LLPANISGTESLLFNTAEEKKKRRRRRRRTAELCQVQ